jgi:hypothetical protein
MAFRFVGGPLDGREFNKDEFDKIKSMRPVSERQGLRIFVLMPDWEGCQGILTGKKEKGEVTSIHAYENGGSVGEEVEFHHSPDELDKAVEEAKAPSSPERD